MIVTRRQYRLGVDCFLYGNESIQPYTCYTAVAFGNLDI